MNEQKNLFLAIALSMLVLLGFQYFFVPAPTPASIEAGKAVQEGTVAVPALASATRGTLPLDTALAETPRLAIASKKVQGSINRRGAQLDDLTLPLYRQSLEEGSPAIRLLSPRDTAGAYMIRFGWVSSDEGLELPDQNTLWETQGDALTPATPVTLTWQSPQNVLFALTLSLDKDYVLNVAQSVTNNTEQRVTVFPYALMARWNPPSSSKTAVFTGPLGVFNGRLVEVSYGDLVDDGRRQFDNQQGGWVGFSDEYWLTALLPNQGETLQYVMNHWQTPQGRAFQVSATAPAKLIDAGQTGTSSINLFAGAKEITLLDAYAEQLGLPLFDRAIDFGWFYFLTRPMFYGLHYIFLYVGNFGIAIILLTIFIRILLSPLAHKSYKALSRMKDLQPKMLELRDKYGDDRMKLQQEMMALYQKEKINPAAGCLPILLQIPVFFALYKVLLVSIEMRHAPFFGWIQDLAAPDPTSIFNLFGLLPYDVPSTLTIGVWPILVGLTMFATQKINPTPPDKIQAAVFNIMPVAFGITTAFLPAGLAVYWTFNNLISLLQQMIIRRMAGEPAIHRKARA
jgi:YidC/Oxa1 family membrane protein insertase